MDPYFDPIAEIKALTRRNFLLVLSLFVMAAWGLGINIWQLQHIAYVQQLGDGKLASKLRIQLSSSLHQLRQMEDSQVTAGDQLINAGDVQSTASQVRLSLAEGNFPAARTELAQLNKIISDWGQTLADEHKARAAAAAAAAEAVKYPPMPVGSQVQAPILLYHHPPADFEAQLQTLQARGYTSINLDQLVAALNGTGGLPAKPVVITFDDGFTDQLTVLPMLQRYNMKATFYIIDGGPGSSYCIGANRTNHTCGDAYMTWDDIRMIDANPLFTIASHTIDHLALAGQSADSQRFQIMQGKAQLEAQIGHPVRHLAYPYGSYNATTIQITKEAGFTSAVSTLPGIIHTSANLFDLHRVRSTAELP